MLLTFIAMDFDFPENSEYLDVDVEFSEEDFARMVKIFPEGVELCDDERIKDIFDRVYAASLAQLKDLEPEYVQKKKESERPNVFYYWPAEVEEAATGQKIDDGD